MHVTYTINKIKTAAKALWEYGKESAVWAFHGEMGAGKTTFIHALCEHIGVKDVVSSPTFAIINEYYSTTEGQVFHMDWYRIKDEEEAVHTGIEDCLFSGNICLIEWPDKVAGILPEYTLHIYITTIDEQTRELRAEIG